MNEYSGPKYHFNESESMQNMCFPVYDCKSSDDENYEHFHHGDTNFLDVLNYRLRDYEQFLPRTNATDHDELSLVGLSDIHHTLEDILMEYSFD